MKQKKGIDTVVAWVLLLGFSISLGVFVFMWATKSTQSMTESTIKSIEGGMQCDQVQVYAVFDPKDSSNPCGYINITNNGYFTLSGIIIRGTKSDGSPIPRQDITSTDFMPLKPKQVISGQTAMWGLPQTGANVDFIPVITEDKTKISCPDKLIRLQC